MDDTEIILCLNKRELELILFREMENLEACSTCSRMRTNPQMIVFYDSVNDAKKDLRELHRKVKSAYDEISLSENS